MAATAAQPQLPVAIEVAEDHLQVVLSVRAGQTLKALDAAAILAALTEKGIKFDARGEAEVHELCRPRKGDRKPVIVARGTAPIDDLPPQIELLIPLDVTTPREVKAGEPVAKVNPGGKGRDGIDVFGKPISRRVADPTPVLGQNLKLAADGTSCVAAIDGMLRVRSSGGSNVISIITSHRHTGDLTDALEFAGDVTVEKNIVPGVIIKAGGSVFAGGDVEAGELVAGGDLLVTGAILGHAMERYTVAGHVHARTIQNISLDAGEDVSIASGIKNARITCRGMLRMPDEAIVGSHISATGGVQCHTLGSPSHCKTLLEIGIDDRLRRMAHAALPEIESRRAKAAKIRAAVEPLMKNPSALTPAQRERCTTLLHEADQLTAHADQIVAELRKEHQAATAAARCEVIINAIAHPGVTLRFPTVETTLRLPQKGPCRIVSQSGDGIDLILLYPSGKSTGIPLERREASEDWLATLKKAAA